MEEKERRKEESRERENEMNFHLKTSFFKR